MEEKTDLRVVRTRKMIQSAFLELREKTPLERVKVRDLCRLAMVNPATFYHYYADIFALSEEMENAVIDRCFQAFPYKDCLFTEPEKFILTVSSCLEPEYQTISILFRNRMEVLYGKLQNLLLNHYRQPDQSPAEEVHLTFAICGAMHTMQILDGHAGCTTELIAKEMAEILRRMQTERK